MKSVPGLYNHSLKDYYRVKLSQQKVYGEFIKLVKYS